MQKEFCKLLIREGYTIAHVAEGNFPGRDIQTTRGKTYEVKADKKSEETGNIFIETSHRGNPSGLCATNADYFVVICKGWAHISSTREALRFMLGTDQKYLVKHAGDDRMSQGYLIKEEHYKPKNLRLYEIGFWHWFGIMYMLKYTQKTLISFGIMGWKLPIRLTV